MHPFKGYIFKLLYITFSISSSLEITNSQTISIYTPNPYIQVVPVIRKLKKNIYQKETSDNMANYKMCKISHLTLDCLLINQLWINCFLFTTNQNKFIAYIYRYILFLFKVHNE